MQSKSLRPWEFFSGRRFQPINREFGQLDGLSDDVPALGGRDLRANLDAKLSVILAD
jgi:hypothetical protein